MAARHPIPPATRPETSAICRPPDEPPPVAHQSPSHGLPRMYHTRRSPLHAGQTYHPTAAVRGISPRACNCGAGMVRDARGPRARSTSSDARYLLGPCVRRRARGGDIPRAFHAVRGITAGNAHVRHVSCEHRPAQSTRPGCPVSAARRARVTLIASRRSQSSLISRIAIGEQLASDLVRDRVGRSARLRVSALASEVSSLLRLTC